MFRATYEQDGEWGGGWERRLTAPPPSRDRAYVQRAVSARIVHSLPWRLRFKVARLSPGLTDEGLVAGLVEAIPGVKRVSVSVYARSVVVEHDGRRGIAAAVQTRLERMDLAAVRRVDDGSPAAHSSFRLLVSTLALVGQRFLPPPAQAALTWMIIAPVLVTGVRALLRSGMKVEVLDAVALAASAAKRDYATSLATRTLQSLGESLEESTNRRSDELLKRLLRPAPTKAWLERDGDLVEVDPSTIKANDVVVVGTGDMIPVDGQVISGAALVNESAVSGEFVPAEREAGARVHAGTVVEQGRLRVRAVLVGDDTTAARIARFLRDSLSRRPNIQQMAERLADQRVKHTLGLGALTWLLTRDVARVASVFLVDYSCALKLGTPVAIKSTMHQGAHRGILIKGGHALEKLAEVDTVVFDKTGTLSHCDLEVTDVVSLATPTWSRRQLLALIASIEEHATHPVAEAVVAAARRRQLDHVGHDEVEFIVAHGMVSEVEAGRVVIGSRHFLEEHEGVSFRDHHAEVERLEAEGKNLLFVAVKSRLTGVVALRDRLRDEAPSTLRMLRQLGIRSLVMITGDRREKAVALAETLGIDEVFAEEPPERKAAIVENLKARGRSVAFVGDGVNDAPALMAAHVGIAMPYGAELARASADIVLTEDRLDAVAEARAMAVASMALIRSNFRLAVGVNSVLLLAAAQGWLPPILSAVLHNGTTIAVLLRGLAGPAAPFRGGRLGR